MNIAHVTNDPRNPWTGEPLPPRPEVSNPENWKFDFAEDGATFIVYDDNAAPGALAFTALAYEDGIVECDAADHPSESLDLDQLEQDAARIPAWIAEIRAVTQWTHDVFGA